MKSFKLGCKEGNSFRNYTTHPSKFLTDSSGFVKKLKNLLSILCNFQNDLPLRETKSNRFRFKTIFPENRDVKKNTIGGDMLNESFII